MSRFFYNLLLLLAAPLILAWFYWPGRRQDYQGRWAEPLGWAPCLRVDLWVHAVSVGEAMAAIPLVKAWQQQHPQARVLFTTTSSTGYGRLQAAFGDSLLHVYAPLDLWPCVWLFFRRVKAAELWIMETELWPNWLAFAETMRVSLVNARLSARSLARYQRFSGLARSMLAKLERVLVQTPTEAQRFQALGVLPEQLTVTGSVKFDITVSTASRQQAAQLAATFDGRPVWVAASTHEGEDSLMLAAHRQLRQQLPEALLILVPRHPQRFDAVAQLLANERWRFARRSQQQEVTADTAVYLADTMGEMLTLLGAAQVAVVAGSFVPVGGHNLLEPAALGLPTLTGPIYHNFQEITEALCAVGNCQVVTAEELAAALLALLLSPEKRQQAGQAGLAVVAQSRGAIARSLKALT
ncbi:lipid IV(A) 3-deoxy-D-manno-octulosonic acid transferase [Gallaecimonas sp. GXIMD1310]|uniref:lipid IV(A) 3-deoxy-D-manno-octulosonic acid transferase n=1 Tax=Gallaecimonas sp. GXIMD1310 TaxID=3131926 RepID=UPI0032538DEC